MCLISHKLRWTNFNAEYAELAPEILQGYGINALQRVVTHTFLHFQPTFHILSGSQRDVPTPSAALLHFWGMLRGHHLMYNHVIQQELAIQF